MLHIIMNNDSSQRTDSYEVENPNNGVQSIKSEQTCVVPQHCSNPAIRERARDSK